MDKILVLDFGGQYNQLIARRVRDMGVYSEILPYTSDIEEIKGGNYSGIIFTGGPNSVDDPQSPHYSKEILNIGLPVLGICYGAQLIAWLENGKVSTAPVSEYGKAELHISKKNSLLFSALSDEQKENSTVWMSHTDYISEIPYGYTITATTANCPVAAMEKADKNIYAVQFHPEVMHSQYGTQMLSSFVFDICHCNGDWTMDNFIETTVENIRKVVGSKTVVLGLSGGVDSAVAAALVSKAIGDQLICVFVDHGLMRKDEGDMVEKTFAGKFDFKFIRINAKDRYLNALKGVVDPEEKRKIVGEQFYKVFWQKIKELPQRGFFAQGTIYPDRIESGKGDADKIKTHHNKVKIPKDIKFEGIIEPLADLFKDEVRKVGKQLGLPDEIVERQPFPGPGLTVRIIGEITDEKIRIVQEADAIFCREVEECGYEKQLAQYFAVLPNVTTVGVMGDHRTYDHLIALRAVTTDNFMTADWARIPYELLAKVSTRITNEVKNVNRVVYDITSKPPGTVEWE